MNENWRDVPGYAGLYEVSDAGRVRSHYHGRVRVLAAVISKRGYPTVGLHLAGRRRRVTTASLVLLAFVGPRPVGMECCHGDGQRANNALSNLRYDTPVGNAADKVAHGTDSAGERNAQAKLTVAAVQSIRGDKRAGRVIAAEHGICRSLVDMIRRGVAWRSA